MKARAQQRGVALITAVLVVALAATAVAAMSARQNIDIRRTGNLLAANQAWLYAQGMEDWALALSVRDQHENQVDHLQEGWAKQLAPLPVEGGELSGRIEDLQGRFNLNNLILESKPSEIDIKRFERLLTWLDIEPTLSRAVVDWIDEDDEPVPTHGAEDEFYLQQNPPYRASNAPLISVSELRFIKGFTAEIVHALTPYVTALPRYTAINVNTAPLPILMILADNLSKSEAEALRDGRGEKGYPSIEDFSQHPVLKNKQFNNTALSLASEFFLLDASVRIDRIRVHQYSLISRNEGGRPAVLMRSRGNF